MLHRADMACMIKLEDIAKVMKCGWLEVLTCPFFKGMKWEVGMTG
jgi:hypothetical protein